MNEFEKLCQHIDNELHKIEDKGLNQSNLETAYKLIDMYKDMAEASYYKMMAEDPMDSMGGHAGYGNGYSGANMPPHMRGMMDRGEYGMESSYARRGRRGRDSMGRYTSGYSGAYDGYQRAKESYRMDKSGACKSNVLDMLSQYMDEIEDELREMSRNADCTEERQEIMKHLEKMRNMMA